MKYQNKRNKRVAEVIEQDDKCKTVLLQYEDGTDTKITFSTLHRWWKALPEEADQVPETIPIKEQVKEVASKILLEEDKASDGTSYKEVMQDIIHDKKVTAGQGKKQSQKKTTGKKSVKKEAVDRSSVWNPINKYLSSTKVITGIRNRGKYFVNVKVDGKVKFEIRLSQTGATIYTRQEIADECELCYSLINNYNLPAVVKLEDEKIMETIKTIVKAKGGK